METWRLLDTGARSGAENMALDETLLELKAAERIPPTLRFLQFSTPTGRVLPKSLWVQLSRSGLPIEWNLQP